MAKKGVPINNEKIAEVIASYALTNSYNKTAHECGISDKTVKKIISNNPKEYEKKKEKFSDYCDRLIYKALGKLDKELDKDDIPINNLTTAIGTLYDKRALSLGEPTNNEKMTIVVEVSDD